MHSLSDGDRTFSSFMALLRSLLSTQVMTNTTQYSQHNVNVGVYLATAYMAWFMHKQYMRKFAQIIWAIEMCGDNNLIKAHMQDIFTLVT